MRKTVFAVILYFMACVMVPYLITVIMSGKSGRTRDDNQTKAVNSDNNDFSNVTDVTDYIVRTVAAYYEAEDDTEYVKALAVIVRTYAEYVKLNGTMADSAHIAPTTLSDEELLSRFGKNYDAITKKIEELVCQTQGEIILYDGQPIFPYFHEISSGKTRTGTEKYLTLADASYDTYDGNYLSITSISQKSLKEKIEKYFSFSDMNQDYLDSFQIVSRDAAGYVDEILINNQTRTGDEFAAACNLASADFFVSKQGDSVIFTVKGRGSGYGLSLTTARAMASKGMGYREIIPYFYKDIQIVNMNK